MIALLLAGTVVFCAGVLAIVFGIPIKEFSFGNTVILCGAVMSSTGLILIGLGILAREVKQLSRRLGSVPRGMEEAEVAEIVVAEVPPPAPAMTDVPPRTAPRAPANGDFLFPRDEPAANSAPENEFEFPLPERAPFPPRPERTEPAAEKPRRDFLFSSRRRKEAAPETAAEPEAAPRTEDDLFEPPWAQSERPAAPDSDFASEPRHPLRRQSRFTPPSRREEPPRREPQPEVSVVKSGVVDAMAYSLYSDGSIEAQLPEGTVRFESIDELRAHLDRR
jgi:hypothetical protein